MGQWEQSSRIGEIKAVIKLELETGVEKMRMEVEKMMMEVDGDGE